MCVVAASESPYTSRAISFVLASLRIRSSSTSSLLRIWTSCSIPFSRSAYS